MVGGDDCIEATTVHHLIKLKTPMKRTQLFDVM